MTIKARLFAAVILIHPLAAAASLSISGSESGTNSLFLTVNQTLDPAAGSRMLLVSNFQNETGDWSGSIGYDARSSFGDLGIDFADSLSVGPGRAGSLSGAMSVGSSDTVYVARALIGSYLQLRVRFATALSQRGSIQTQSDFIQYRVEGNGTPFYFDDVSCSASVSDCVTARFNQGTIDIPLRSNGSTAFAALSQTMTFDFSCSASFSFHCAQSGDAFHSANIGGATVVDSSFNTVAGAVITSDSGYDYTLALATPEPASIALIFSGFFVLSMFPLRSRRRVAPKRVVSGTGAG